MKRSRMKRSVRPMKRTRLVRRRRAALRAKPDPRMAAWSKEVLERDGHHCRWPGCPEQGSHVHAHHIQTRKQRPDLRYIVSNGKAICPKHHDFLHHVVAGRIEARRLGLLGGKSYELSQREAA